MPSAVQSAHRVSAELITVGNKQDPARAFEDLLWIWDYYEDQFNSVCFAQWLWLGSKAMEKARWHFPDVLLAKGAEYKKLAPVAVRRFIQTGGQRDAWTLANVIFACARMRICDVPLWPKLLKAAKTLIPQFNSAVLTSMAWSLAIGEGYENDFPDMLAAEAQQRKDFSVLGLCQLLWDMAVTRPGSNEELFAKVMPQFEAKAEQFNSASLQRIHQSLLAEAIDAPPAFERAAKMP
ncbi:MAG: hypothetical protein IT292_03050 [Deltaproteobacteria bacterium]|nr:hypothetical protein [Deltaproteobacteria bacterium]